MSIWRRRRLSRCCSFLRGSRHGADRDAGFTLLEMVVGVTLLAMVAVGFAASVHFGFRTIALARQRQTASEVASAALEHVRSVPYDDIRLDTKPTHDSAPDHPNYFVGGDDYDHDGDIATPAEKMVVATGSESWGVLHEETPVVVGSTQMEIYQYVTWVDDPIVAGTQDYKRVSVVVLYKAPSVNGVNEFVRASSLFARDGIEFGAGTSTTTTVASSTTTAATTTSTTAATTTTTPTGSCSGDVTPPTGGFAILGGGGAQAGYTASANVTIAMAFSDACEPVVANFQNESGPLGADVVYSTGSSEFSHTLSAGDGTKTVGGVVRDGVANQKNLATVNIILDSTPPTTPGTLTRAVGCSGNNRTVTLNWGISTDDHFEAYRVYRDTGSGYSEIGTTSVSSFTDVHNKTINSVKFFVVGYDKAGNESNGTNEITLSKNQCS